jgi:glycerophosphoryl diester phosphodiesterase
MTNAIPLPRVLGHRGSSEAAAEHTLAAYRAALDAGADGLECDVRLTRDGVPICIHDRRVDRTSDGVGVVSALGLDDLAVLDFALDPAGAGSAAGAAGAAAAAAGEDVDRDGAGVLTLERLLDVVVERGGPVELVIETKHPNRYGRSVEHLVVTLLRARGLDRAPANGGPSVRVMSFSALALARVKRLAPELRTVHLVSRATAPLATGRLPIAADDVGPSIGLLRRDPGYARRMQRRGRQVLVWTVNSAADVELCCRAGVDAIITDRPRAVREMLQARRHRAG